MSQNSNDITVLPTGSDTNSLPPLELGNPKNDEKPPKIPKQSLADQLTNQFRNTDFKIVTKEEYERLTKKDGWAKSWIKSPTFANTMFIAIITYGWTAFDYGMSKYIKNKINEVSMETKPNTPATSQ